MGTSIYCLVDRIIFRFVGTQYFRLSGLQVMGDNRTFVDLYKSGPLMIYIIGSKL